MARRPQSPPTGPPADGRAPAVAAPRHPHRVRRRLIVSGAAILVVAGGLLALVWAIEPANPGSFYDLPPAVHIGAPGSILRQASVATGLAGARVSKILYASTDRNDRPIAVSGVVVVPTGPVPPGGRPIVAWAHGTTGVASRCAPSLESDAGIGRIPLLHDLVAEGAVVVATDYPGLGTPGPHPYLVGESEGRAVLDSVRAAEALDRGPSSDKVVLMGHSQGGHAVLFAAQLSRSYAPDLHVVGVVAMAPPTDLSELLAQDVHETAGVVLTALAITGWTHTYPGLSSADILESGTQPFVDELSRGCVEDTGQGLVDLPGVLVLQHRFLSRNPAATPGWSEAFVANDPSPRVQPVPMLVAQGLSDTLVRPDTTIHFVKQACADHAQIDLDTYPGVGHFAVRTAALPQVLPWIRARLGGTPTVTGCTTTADQPLSPMAPGTSRLGTDRGAGRATHRVARARIAAGAALRKGPSRPQVASCPEVASPLVAAIRRELRGVHLLRR